MRGGAERQLIEVATGLEARGYSVAVLTFNPSDSWDSKITKCGLPLYAVKRSRWRLRRALSFLRKVREWEPQIIHSWSHHTNVYAAVLRKVYPAKYLASLRSNPAVDNESGESRARIAHSWAYSAADAVVSNSKSSLEAAARNGVRMRNGHTVGNVVRAPGEARPELQPETIRITAVGCLKPIKGYDVLLRALGQVRRRHKFVLHLAGEGPEKERLAALAEEQGIGDRVEMMGDIENIPELLASSHLFVHPSRMEGLSNSVLEAMGQGLPVIVTPVGAIPEYARQRETALHVRLGDEADLASKINLLIESPALRQSLGSAALREIRSKCTPSIVLRGYERVYGSLFEIGDAQIQRSWEAC